MKTEFSNIVSTMIVCFVFLLEVYKCCELQCGQGYQCAMRRSTCDYPPCPYFATCVVTDNVTSRMGTEARRPGQCPVPSPPGPCIHQCRADSDCPDSEKCCFNGCGNTCRPVVNESPVKPGSCPLHLATLRTACQEECETDSDCAGVRKCCKTSCGSKCTDPCFYWLRSRSSSKRSIMWKLPYICRQS